MAFNKGVSYSDGIHKSFSSLAPVQKFEREFKIPSARRVKESERQKFGEPSMVKHICWDTLPVWLSLAGILAGVSFIQDGQLGGGIVLALFGGGLCLYLYPKYIQSSLRVTEFQNPTWLTERDLEKTVSKAMGTLPTLVHKTECYSILDNRYGFKKEIISYSESVPLHFSNQIDYSPYMEFESDSAQVLKLYFQHEFRAGDQDTEVSLQQARDQVRGNCEGRDNLMRTEDVYEIPNLPSVILVNRGNDEKIEIPCWFSKRLYLFCTVVTLAAPYRLWVESSYVKERVYTTLKALFVIDARKGVQQKINQRKETQYTVV